MRKSTGTHSSKSKKGGHAAGQHRQATSGTKAPTMSRRLPLIAVTATGPIYRKRVKIVVVPVSVSLALLQELALRAVNPRAQVVSSLANRVDGDMAMRVWTRCVVQLAVGLATSTPQARVAFLQQVMKYVSRQGNANGVEPVVCAAVNAAWPWLGVTAVERTLKRASRYLEASEFARAFAVPVVDPSTRAMTIAAAGELARFDITDWLDWRALTVDNHGMWTKPWASLGGFDPGGMGGFDPGGMGGFGPGGMGGFGPGGMGGFGAGGMGGFEEFGMRKPELSGLGGNGGPFGFGSALGQSGAATPNDANKGLGTNLVDAGKALVALGGAAVFMAPHPIVKAIGGGTAIIGAGLWGAGAIIQYDADIAKPDPSAPAPKPSDNRPPPKDEPQEDDTYPDPEGEADGVIDLGDIDNLPSGDGGGRPDTIWDESGGGGTPNTIWDEHGGGGTPNTIWDENGGGGTPSTTGRFVNATVLTGRGLLAGVTQVGPSTLSF